MQALRPRQIERDAPLVAVLDAEPWHLLIHLFENIIRSPVDAAPPVRILYRLDSPRSARVRVQIGPAQPIEKSITRTPSSGSRSDPPDLGNRARAAASWERTQLAST